MLSDIDCQSNAREGVGVGVAEQRVEGLPLSSVLCTFLFLSGRG
jgi:hypothetical protein